MSERCAQNASAQSLKDNQDPTLSSPRAEPICIVYSHVCQAGLVHSFLSCSLLLLVLVELRSFNKGLCPQACCGGCDCPVVVSRTGANQACSFACKKSGSSMICCGVVMPSPVRWLRLLRHSCCAAATSLPWTAPLAIACAHTQA